MRHKVDEVRLLLQICHLEILAITETHLDSKISNQQLEVENYKIFRRDREGKQGGGCLIYVMNHICAIRLRSLEATEIEQIWLRISSDSNKGFTLGVVYRPPDSTTFFENFDRNLEKVWLKYKEIVMVGDFNCDFTVNDNGTIVSALGNK